MIVSFFYGLDINVATLVGIAMLVTSIIKYVPKTRAFIVSGLSITIVTVSLYIYFGYLVFKDSELISLTDYLALLPLLCLGLLIFNYSKLLTTGISENNT